MPIRSARNCSDFWNLIPFVRVRHAGPCEELARKVGYKQLTGARGAALGRCRLEIAMRGRSVTSLFLSMPDAGRSEGGACAGEDGSDSFLLVAPPREGPPGHAIDDEVWTT